MTSVVLVQHSEFYFGFSLSPRLSDVELSVVLTSVFAIGSALAYLLFFQECSTPPHV